MVSAEQNKSNSEKPGEKKGGRSNRSPLKGTGFEREEVRRRPLRLSRGFRSVPGDRPGLRPAASNARALRRSRKDRFRRPLAVGPLAWTDQLPRACRPGRITRSARRPATSSRVHLRLGVLARDRPAAPNQSADWGTTGGPVTTGPIRPFYRGSGTSPEVCSPTAHTSRVARSFSRGGRPPVDPASAFHHRPPALCREPRPASLAHAVLRFPA